MMPREIDFDQIAQSIPGCTVGDLRRLVPTTPRRLAEALRRGFTIRKDGHVWRLTHPSDRSYTLATDVGLTYINQVDFRL